MRCRESYGNARGWMGVIEVDESKPGGSPQESRTRDSYVPWILLYYCDTTVNPHLEYELLAFDVSGLQDTCNRGDPLKLTGAKNRSACRAEQSLICDSWLGFLLTLLPFLTTLLTSLSRHTDHFLTTHQRLYFTTHQTSESHDCSIISRSFPHNSTQATMSASPPESGDVPQKPDQEQISFRFCADW